MALFPLVSNFRDDFVLKLLPVDTEQTMAEVAKAAASHSIGIHVAPQPGRTIRARKQGAAQPFALDAKLSSTGLEPMDCVEFYFE